VPAHYDKEQSPIQTARASKNGLTAASLASALWLHVQLQARLLWKESSAFLRGARGRHQSRRMSLRRATAPTCPSLADCVARLEAMEEQSLPDRESVHAPEQSRNHTLFKP
jgi:hypothetical protein